MQLRDYQRAAVDSIYRYFETGASGNPLVVMPTGSGKSFVIATFIRETLEAWPDQRILIVTHRKELISQNYAELVGHWPLAPAGIYSAGLNRRDAGARVLFCGIQTVYGKAALIGKTDLVLIDECHLVPRRADTMYLQFLTGLWNANNSLKVVGLSATPFRLDSGLLSEGDSRVFTDICHEVPVRMLVERGYLAPLVGKRMKTEYDLSGVHVRGGEYVAGELEAAMDQESLTALAVNEMAALGAERRSWLVFCAGVSHAGHVRDELRRRGIGAESLTGGTHHAEREKILTRFKAGELRALTSCEVLTTGFNAPSVDLIAFLRPTQSAGLYVQMAGRGMRTAPGKIDCLVLDYAGNVMRHGPVDAVTVRPRCAGEGRKGDAPAKACPQCDTIIHASANPCPHCGYQFPSREARHDETAYSGAIMTPDPEWCEVRRVLYSRWEKPGKPDSIRVEYEIGLDAVSEWVCPDHGGYATSKAGAWVNARLTSSLREAIGQGELMLATDSLLGWCEYLLVPSAVLVAQEGKYKRVIDYRDFHEPRPGEARVAESEIPF